MAKAFLSHSSKDKELVEKIANQLGRNNCHFDSLTFEAGHETLTEIFNGLEETDIFVLFLLETSLNSEWVKKEITQAKKLNDNKIIERIFPLIIDKSITHKDSRIPDWIKKPYNIKFFDNEVLVLKKIKQFLRESNIRKYSHLQELNDLFVGRHDMIQDFERKLVTIENTKPTCIIGSSYFEGIGRRTFIKHGLIRTGIIDKWYEPIPISIGAKESLEDFIYKLSFIGNAPEIFKHDFSQENLSAKIDFAISLIHKYVNIGEVLFIIDEGSIVLPNHTLVEWFKGIIKAPQLQNQVSICLISKFRPYIPLIKKLGNVVTFQVDELSAPDTQTFFLQYLRLLKKEILAEDTKFFLQYMKGIPGQIIYTASLIDSLGAHEAKRFVNEIEEFDELRALSIFEFLEDDPLCKQMLIALSKFEIISYDLVYKIFGESDDVYRSIQKLFDLTLFFSVSSTHQYIKLNSSISDYINRSRIELDQKHNNKIKEIANESLKNPLELNENSDYSEFLLTLQTMIREKLPIPSKYLIPSFILKSIIKEYNDRNYSSVIQLAEKILENDSRFDFQIIRETRLWLCLAYCRTQNTKLFELVRLFNVGQPYESLKDYYFLLGFYYRNDDKMVQAEYNFLKVLDTDSNHSRTKRELVNVYLRQGEYMKALNWAKDNYERFKTNILHIQAYFTCLIKKPEKTDSEIEVIHDLLSSAKKSLDSKAFTINREMKAEFDFYVDGNLTAATSSLEESLKLNNHNYFAFRALLEIYVRNQMQPEIDLLVKNYPNLKEEY